MALFLPLLVLPLTACNKDPTVSVNSVSQVYIPDDKFECLAKPPKPIKVTDPVAKVMKYRDSDLAKYLNNLYLSREDCETKLHGVREIYKAQVNPVPNPNDFKAPK